MGFNKMMYFNLVTIGDFEAEDLREITQFMDASQYALASYETPEEFLFKRSKGHNQLAIIRVSTFLSCSYITQKLYYELLNEDALWLILVYQTENEGDVDEFPLLSNIAIHYHNVLIAKGRGKKPRVMSSFLNLYDIMVKKKQKEFLWILTKKIPVFLKNGTIKFVPLESVCYIEKKGKGVDLHCHGLEALHSNATINFYLNLKAPHFFIARQGCIINMSAVISIEKGHSNSTISFRDGLYTFADRKHIEKLLKNAIIV